MSFRHQLRRGLLALPMLCLLTAGFFSVRFAPQPEQDFLRTEACQSEFPVVDAFAG
ncbi:hypothetical protein M2650_14615 [Luteimonas sp. SX5]|uniref:Uncharacterized protein n=1 Tax=Luteimonas galliterrae TaxID=2940486 RepID=A0ABT0MLU3_9GAMM|nr:hypothetical protein [Luteimonas galliterrae]MCL1635859.1 hypothetical protein [Luteimonas galliterrae]